MSKTYKIYFTNDSGFDNNYAFFSDLPKVSMNGGDNTVYANVVASQRVKSDDGDSTWEIDVTQTYYAWCSKSPVSVKTLPGHEDVVTKMSNSKLAHLGAPGEPGSTFWLVDDTGSPAFESSTEEAPDGSFQIAAKTDAFQPDQDFVCGLGSVDGDGNRIPVATFTAQANTIATITPVVKFYISMFGATQGTIINVATRSLKAASIDFTGKSATAVHVKQKAGGGWQIDYGSSTAMRSLAKAAKAPPPKNDAARYKELAKLVKQLELALVGVSSDPDPNKNYFTCRLGWNNGVTAAQKAGPVSSLTTNMGTRGHRVIQSPDGPTFAPATWIVESSSNLDTVRQDWASAVALQALCDPATPTTAQNPPTSSLFAMEGGSSSDAVAVAAKGVNGIGAGQDLEQLIRAARKISGYPVH